MEKLDTERLSVRFDSPESSDAFRVRSGMIDEDILDGFKPYSNSRNYCKITLPIVHLKRSISVCIAEETKKHQNEMKHFRSVRLMDLQ